MKPGSVKEKLRSQYLFPKKQLKQIRLARELTTSHMGALIGLSRRQYELKEHGRYPFNDYEMLILSQYLKQPITLLFFDHQYLN